MTGGSSTPTTGSHPPAGWYADPLQAGRWRYWDGQAWTDDLRNEEPGDPAASVPAERRDAGTGWPAPATSDDTPGWAPPAMPTGVAPVSRPATDSPLTRRGWAVVGGVVAVLVLLGFLASGGSTYELDGTFTLRDSGFEWLSEGAPCSGSGGYSDIRSGTQVAVTDGTGELVGIGRLGSGTAEPDPLGHMSCVFEFTVSDLPSRDTYTVSVSHRGDLSYSRSELDAAGWQVDFVLGR